MKLFHHIFSGTSHESILDGQPLLMNWPWMVMVQFLPSFPVTGLASQMQHSQFGLSNLWHLIYLQRILTWPSKTGKSDLFGA